VKPFKKNEKIPKKEPPTITIPSLDLFRGAEPKPTHEDSFGILSDHSEISFDESEFSQGTSSQGSQEIVTSSYREDSLFAESDTFMSYGNFTPAKNRDNCKDQSSELYCSEYASGIYDYLRQREGLFLPNSDYISKLQPDLTPNMREILMDWLVEVAEEYEVALETLLLAKNYIDRYLSRRQIRRGRLQLLGITALLIASKYEELCPVQVDCLVYITDNTYEKQEVLSFEYELLSALDFNISIVTEKNFLRRYLLAAVAGISDESIVHQTVRLSHYLVERTIQVYDFVKFPPSIVACSAICLALHTLAMDPWTSTLEYYTAISQSNPLFLNCTVDMLTLFRFSRKDPGYREMQAVNQKYRDLFDEFGIHPPDAPPLSQ